jgi:hypothetical protein
MTLMVHRTAAVFALVLPLAALGGCSFFSHSVTWTKSGATQEQAESDLATCTEEAKTQTDRDTSIDQDIAAADTSSNPVDTTPLQNMQSFKHRQRFKSVLEDCMAQLGYSKVD